MRSFIPMSPEPLGRVEKGRPRPSSLMVSVISLVACGIAHVRLRRIATRLAFGMSHDVGKASWITR